MTQHTTTIRKLATLVNTPVDTLLEQLAGAGMDFTDPDQAVTSTEKVKLLGFLRRAHGKAEPKTVEAAVTPKKITLNRSKKEEITVGGGKNRMTVDVTVRKKVTLVKPSALAAAKKAAEAEAAAAAAAAKPVAPPVVEAAPVAEVVVPPPVVEAAPVVVEPVAVAPVEPAPVVEPPAPPPEAKAEPAPVVEAAAPKAEDAAPAAAEKPATPAGPVRKKATRRVSAAELERQEILRKLEESRQRNLDEQRRLAESDRRRDEERKAEAERARLAAIEAERKAAERAANPEPAKPEPRKPAAGAGAAAKPGAAKPAKSTGKDGARKGQRGSNAMSSDDDEGGSRLLHLSASDRDRRSRSTRGKTTGGRGRRQVIEPARGGGGAHGFERPTAPVVREVAIGEAITVADLAGKLALKGGDVVKALFKMGVMVTINQTIDHDTAVLVVEELGHKAVAAERDDAESALIAQHMEQSGERHPRPPVITIMGHVDHGKTSLLDYIRRTKVAPGEAGGITQHIGAYHVETGKGTVSFLDTPGHSAFASMRARGAKLTDVVVLVVAADDGVMPQTIEAIQHARTAKVPLVVAINKIDKSGADPGKIKNELLAHDVVAEDFGGDTQMVELSAKTGQGVDELLDALLLQAEVLELTAITEGRASGTVIESSLDKGRGPIATVLVQQGQLAKGDYLVCGIQYGRVRALFDETGKQVPGAGPSIPVQVLGLSGVPEAGDDFIVVEDERLAKDVAQQRDTKRRELRLVATASNRMEDIMAKMGQSDVQQVLNLVVKADVQGSVEALKQSLTGLSNDQIRINVLVSGVGGITESDANAAATAKATIIGFNVRADASARRVIETNGLDLRYFSIIYDVIDQVKQVASGLLGVEIREEIIGTAEVRDVFRSSKFGAIAGSMVIEGVVKRNKPIRVLRDSVVVFEGELESLRRFKENVDEVRNGTECGIGVKAYNDVQPGDQIECFERIEVQRTL